VVRCRDASKCLGASQSIHTWLGDTLDDGSATGMANLASCSTDSVPRHLRSSDIIVFALAERLCGAPNRLDPHPEFYLRWAQDSIAQRGRSRLFGEQRKYVRKSRRVMTGFRAVRLALDHFASIQGRKDAKELCLLYGRGSLPRTLLDRACLSFRELANRALKEARIEGDQDALFAHLMELWQMNFTLEIKRPRRKSAQRS
jgi:hypothetical protein